MAEYRRAHWCPPRRDRQAIRHLAACAIAIGIACTGCARLGLEGWNDVRFDAPSGVLATRVAGDRASGEGVTLVRARLNDQSLWMLLDTGSEVVVIDKSIAEAQRLEAGPLMRLGGCGIRARVTRGERFQVGPMRFSDPVFLAIDLKPFLAEVDTPVRIDGILGRPALDSSVLEVAYTPNGDRATLYNPGTYPGRQDLNAGSFSHSRPVVPLILPGGTRAVVAIDTGKSGTLSFSSHFAQRANLADRFAPAHPAQNKRLCGISRESEIDLPNLDVAGYKRRDVSVRIRLPGTEAARSETRLDGVLGRELLRAHRLAIDFANKRTGLWPLREINQE